MPILTWNTREVDLQTAENAPYLALSGQKVFGDSNDDNLLVQGDNLAALKALMPHYAGAVKCVFIDPPYNTGHAFEQYSDNLQHTEWLKLMHPRISLLREMLSDDGSIWITIDDDEAHYLKVIMDEIFGRKNFVANIVWQKKHTRANDARWFSDNHDHILVYARQKINWSINLMSRSSEQNDRFSNPDNDPRGPWMSQPIQVKTPNDEYIYEIENLAGGKFWPPKGRSWGFSKERYNQLVADNRVWFGKKGTNVPRTKKFLSEVQEGLRPITIWPHSEVGHNQSAKQEAKAFNTDDVFSTPKPEKLIERILHLATKPGDLVLDSFLGSGTTAAVAHKMHRRWIGVEMGGHAKTHCIPRLQEVIEGEQGGISESANWQGGGGFHFVTLGKTVFNDNGHVNQDIDFATLAAHLWFKETHLPMPRQKTKSPFLGIHRGIGIALLYNGILHDKKSNGGNMLNAASLAIIRQNSPKDFGGKLLIYGNGCQFKNPRMKSENIKFRQVPYDCLEEK